MLVQLKNQKLLPTVLFTIFYLAYDSLFFVLTYILGYAIWMLVLIAIGGLLEGVKLNPNVLVVSSQIGIAVIATVNEIFQTKKFHQDHFKKYPLTPLFFIAMAVISTTCIMVWWNFIALISATI